MRNAKGGFDLIHNIKTIDLERNDMVLEIVRKSLAMSKQIAELKEQMFKEINSFVSNSFRKYKVKPGGTKGNMSFASYDGMYKVQVAVNDTIAFDERLQIAKQLIDECIKEWSVNADTKLLALIQDAFYVGKAGKISTERILGLRRLNITDKKWKKAMDAISESVIIQSSKQYIRIYKRNNQTDKYELVNLDIAKI